MKKCIYCGGSGLTKEHVISSGVLRYLESIGGEINWTTSHLKGQVMKGDMVISDVCEDCNNNKLSIYDAAGINFTKSVHKERTLQNNSLDFDQQTLGWFIKSHLNQIRVGFKNGGLPLRIDPSIYSSLMNNVPISPKLIRFYYSGIDFDSHKQIIAPFIARFKVEKSTQVIISMFGILNFVTYLLIPHDADYKQFGDRTRFLIDKGMRNSEGNYNLHRLKPETLNSREQILIEKMATVELMKGSHEDMVNFMNSKDNFPF